MAAQNPKKVYVGNLPRYYAEEDLHKDFSRFGTILRTEFKGRFGFIEFDSSASADDAIRIMDNSKLGSERIRVKSYNYVSLPEKRGYDYRGVGNSERTQYRVIVLNLHERTTWKDLKDFGRRAGLVNYADVMRNSDGTYKGILEFQQAEAMRTALETLSGQYILGAPVRIIAENDLKDSRSPTQRSSGANYSNEPKENYSLSDIRNKMKYIQHSPTYHDNYKETYIDSRSASVGRYPSNKMYFVPSHHRYINENRSSLSPRHKAMSRSTYMENRLMRDKMSPGGLPRRKREWYEELHPEINFPKRISDSRFDRKLVDRNKLKMRPTKHVHQIRVLERSKSVYKPKLSSPEVELSKINNMDTEYRVNSETIEDVEKPKSEADEAEFHRKSFNNDSVDNNLVADEKQELSLNEAASDKNSYKCDESCEKNELDCNNDKDKQEDHIRDEHEENPVIVDEQSTNNVNSSNEIHTNENNNDIYYQTHSSSGLSSKTEEPLETEFKKTELKEVTEDAEIKIQEDSNLSNSRHEETEHQISKHDNISDKKEDKNSSYEPIQHDYKRRIIDHKEDFQATKKPYMYVNSGYKPDLKYRYTKPDRQMYNIQYYDRHPKKYINHPPAYEYNQPESSYRDVSVENRYYGHMVTARESTEHPIKYSEHRVNPSERSFSDRVSPRNSYSEKFYDNRYSKKPYPDRAIVSEKVYFKPQHERPYERSLSFSGSTSNIYGRSYDRIPESPPYTRDEKQFNRYPERIYSRSPSNRPPYSERPLPNERIYDKPIERVYSRSVYDRPPYDRSSYDRTIIHKTYERSSNPKPSSVYLKSSYDSGFERSYRQTPHHSYEDRQVKKYYGQIPEHMNERSVIEIRQPSRQISQRYHNEHSYDARDNRPPMGYHEKPLPSRLRGDQMHAVSPMHDKPIFHVPKSATIQYDRMSEGQHIQQKPYYHERDRCKQLSIDERGRMEGIYDNNQTPHYERINRSDDTINMKKAHTQQ